MLGYFGDASMVGMYAVSGFLFIRLTVLARAIGFGVGPLFAKENIGQEERGWFLLRGLKYAMIVTIPVAVYAMVNGEALIVFLFGKGYAGTGTIVALLSVHFLMSSILAVISPTLDFVGKAKIRAVAAFLGASVNIMMNILLIPEYGVAGAVIGTIIGYLVFSIIVLINISDLLRAVFIEATSLKRLILYVAPLMLIIFASIRVLNDGMSALINAVLLCILYPGALWVFSVVDKHEIALLKRTLP
jgi:O-antigen/teichoic acid export membrane protein